MSKEHVLSSNDSRGFAEVLAFARKWCAENQWAVGVGEMAVGASLISWGVHNGVIEMGTQLVATEIEGSNVESIVATIGGSGIGAFAGSILSSIGLASMGGPIGVPAALILGGAAAVRTMVGYTASNVIEDAVNAVDINALATNGSVLLVGVALIVDGARRCIKDQKVLSVLSLFKDQVLVLNDLRSKIIAQSMEELQGFIAELKKLPEDNIQASIGIGSTALGAGIGASTGGVAAASTVTVLGSQALGGAAVSLGLVSMPVWPIVAGVAGGAGIGYTAYKAIKYWRTKPDS